MSHESYAVNKLKDETKQKNNNTNRNHDNAEAKGSYSVSSPFSVDYPGEPGTHYRRHRWGLGRFPSSSTCSGFHLAS